MSGWKRETLCYNSNHIKQNIVNNFMPINLKINIIKYYKIPRKTLLT